MLGFRGLLVGWDSGFKIQGLQAERLFQVWGFRAGYGVSGFGLRIILQLEDGRLAQG